MVPRILWVCLLLACGCAAGAERDEEPTLVLRCVDGRVDAYLAMGGSGEGDAAAEQMVPVDLDSAPGCERGY